MFEKILKPKKSLLCLCPSLAPLWVTGRSLDHGWGEGCGGGGGDSSVGSVLGSLSCLMQCHGFDTPLRRIFPIEAIFPFELTWDLTPFPPKSYGWEYKLRCSLCTHAFHLTDLKGPDINDIDGWMPATKAHPACTIHEEELTTLMVGIKTVTYSKISPKWWTPEV